MRKLLHRYRRHIDRASQGQALAEFALIAVVLLLLFGTALDLGRVFYANITIENAARAGALQASKTPNSFQNRRLRLRDEQDRLRDDQRIAQLARDHHGQRHRLAVREHGRQRRGMSARSAAGSPLARHGLDDLRPPDPHPGRLLRRPDDRPRGDRRLGPGQSCRPRHLRRRPRSRRRPVARPVRRPPRLPPRLRPDGHGDGHARRPTARDPGPDPDARSARATRPSLRT